MFRTLRCSSRIYAFRFLAGLNDFLICAILMSWICVNLVYICEDPLTRIWLSQFCELSCCVLFWGFVPGKSFRNSTNCTPGEICWMWHWIFPQRTSLKEFTFRILHYEFDDLDCFPLNFDAILALRAPPNTSKRFGSWFCAIIVLLKHPRSSAISGFRQSKLVKF